jgi:hypothetical protein
MKASRQICCQRERHESPIRAILESHAIGLTNPNSSDDSRPVVSCRYILETQNARSTAVVNR